MALVLIGAPIDSVGRSRRRRARARALRELGLAEAIGAADRGDLDVRIRGDERDPETGIVAGDDVLAATAEIRAAVADAIARFATGRWSWAAAARSFPGRSAAPATRSARSGWPTSTATPTSTTARHRPPARPPTCRSR